MIDCHLHLQDEKLYPQADRIIERLREIGVKKLVVNGTEPADWDRVAELADRFPEVIPFFGLHPWRVNDAKSGWEDQLREYLEHDPSAGVGEAGLDKWIHGHDIDRQKEVFLLQLGIARDLERPVAVHCLQAWGHLLECIQQGMVGDSTLLSPILLHSFGGPSEMVEDFRKLGAFFSVSGYFFRPEKAEKLEVFGQVPEDCLLIETDAPDMMPPPHLCLEDDGSGVNQPSNIKLIYQAVADWRGESVSVLGSRTESNFNAWYHADRVRETASDNSVSE